jgi:acetylglutamate kinase
VTAAELRRREQDRGGRIPDRPVSTEGGSAGPHRGGVRSAGSERSAGHREAELLAPPTDQPELRRDRRTLGVRGLAVGLCGSDGGLIKARSLGDGSHGLVGEVASVDPGVLEPLLAAGYMPVISSVAPDGEGRAHNINADTVAGELAAAMQAEKLVLLTDTAGILRDRHDPSSLIRQLSLNQARQLIAEGIVDGGMTPKTDCCIRALAQGVGAAHLIDGRVPQSLLLELFTNAGTGTMVIGATSQLQTA